MFPEGGEGEKDTVIPSNWKNRYVAIFRVKGRQMLVSEFVKGGENFGTLSFCSGETHVFVVEFRHVFLEEGSDSRNGGFSIEGLGNECFRVGNVGEDGEVGRGWVEMRCTLSLTHSLGIFCVCNGIGVASGASKFHGFGHFFLEGLASIEHGILGTPEKFGTKIADINIRFLLLRTENGELIDEGAYDDTCENSDKGEYHGFDWGARCGTAAAGRSSLPVVRIRIHTGSIEQR